ncbi:MAG: TIGR02266 family protein [Archangium sp.]|nr:TIGR02266 family protein [Archangium sp.]
MDHNRSTQRKLVGLLVKLAHKGVDEFASKYATNLSDGGMFIRTREPKPQGTELSFKVEIADGQRVLQGVAIVRWTRAEGDPNGPPGMGLEFLKLDPASRALVDRMLGFNAAAVPKIAPATTPSRGLPVAAAIAPVTTPSKQLPVAPPKPSFELADELFGDAPAPSEDEPLADEPFEAAAAFAAPPLPPPPPALTPVPAAEPKDAFSDPDVFGALAASNSPEKEIDIELDALVAETPQPPPLDLFSESSASGFEVELELAEVVPPAPFVAPPLKARPEPVPEVRAPVVLDQPAAVAPPPQPLSGTPIYLKDIKPSDGTGPVIGIDLGTTNSACAVLSKGRPIILSSKDGYNTIPSVVALNAQGKLQVGHRARSQMVLNPTQSIFGAKRLVGREFESPTVRQVKERSHFEIVAGHDRRAAVKLGANVLSLEEVQGLVLKECKEMAEQALGTSVTRAVVTCPAYYSEPQREAVRRAGAMAGLKVERVLNEPTAAALAFGMNRELKKTVLVYDLGGGTFDATLLKLDQNVFEVLATGGDVFLGGVDFDNQLVDLLLERFATWHKRPFSGDRVALSRINEVAEKMKMALSERQSFDVHLPMLEMDAGGKPLDLRTTVTRAEVEAVCSELVERTIQAVQDVLLDAKMKASQVDDIILVGGMSRMPLVREKLKAVFKKPAQASVNADEAVALGAALYSGTVDKVSSLVLIDVVPMTIGLGRPGGGFHRLIERNTPLPATKSFGISTQKNDETELEVMVFQGEDSNVAGNEFLGAVTISGLPKGPAGSVQVAITLGLDAECVLRVEAREFRSRQVVRSTLATRYTSEEIAQRLGISTEKREAVNKSRGDELEKRAGGFWGKLKSLFKR